MGDGNVVVHQKEVGGEKWSQAAQPGNGSNVFGQWSWPLKTGGLQRGHGRLCVCVFIMLPDKYPILISRARLEGGGEPCSTRDRTHQLPN